MTRLRWRAIARALGVPRSELALHTRILRSGHKRHGNWFTLGNRWTLYGLREWAADFEPEPKPTYLYLSLGPDGLRIEEP